MTDDARMQSLMAYIDGEMTPAEREKFERALAADPRLAQLAAEYRALAERAERASFPEPPAETWDGYWEHVRSKMGRRFGWLFAAIGAAVLIVAGIWSYYSHPHNPLAEWGVGLSLAGLAILFLTVLRERLKELKHDRYRNVRR